MTRPVAVVTEVGTDEVPARVAKQRRLGRREPEMPVWTVQSTVDGEARGGSTALHERGSLAWRRKVTDLE